MRKTLCALLLAVVLQPVFAQTKLAPETPAQKQKRMAWWQHDRFGMFIHWGLYALPARNEWVKHNEKINDSTYQVYFDMFDPDLYDAKRWALKAKQAGMKYAVLTTKHHDGFCLFDSKYTDYKATNTAAKRDLVREFVDAFRAQGIKIGFYYSLLDWHHPDFTIDRIHPQAPKDATDADYARLNKGRDMARYRQYMRNQITELLTNYGKIDILWLDFSYPDKNGKGRDDWRSVELLKLIKKLQPGIILDNRLDINDLPGGADFETPEQVGPEELMKYRGKPFETCQTFSGSWGYYRDETTWKTQRQLLDLLITSTANGGNLILNVGPTARGEFDYRANNALDSIAHWMHANSKSIYGCTYAPAEFKAPDGTRLTYNPVTRRLYVHLLDYPDKKIKLSGFQGKVRYAQFLHDDSELIMHKNDNDITLDLSKTKPPYVVPVIELVMN
ncbi:alpha-L-fucosidase [Mucilaginibacter limnophilus]|uniref:alpha-L-fucosidase n=1 Tax=Mucilaginibacter limnophilus TaxID=1932778 RepID=A0A3S2Y1X9_9SPHI|nr:alpha-L-fucosidase [Mucilaginibacter limnophilus]RVT99890.1 alpha-L-fucosidase [Mucilaginibacter limnophilus]